MPKSRKSSKSKTVLNKKVHLNSLKIKLQENNSYNSLFIPSKADLKENSEDNS